MQTRPRPEEGTRPPEPLDPSNLETPPPSLASRFFNLRTLLSFGLGFGVLIFAISQMGVEAGAILARLGQAEVGYLLAALVVYYLSFPVRGLRWRRLLWNAGLGAGAGPSLPSLSRLSTILLLSWFANCVVPARLGDAYRAFLLKQQAGVSFARTVGTVLAERIIDTLLLVLLLGGSALLAFGRVLPGEVLGIMQVGLALVVAVAVGLLVMANLGAQIRRVIPRRFRSGYLQLEQGTFASFRALPLVVGYSALAWGIEAARLYLVSRSLGLDSVSIPVLLFLALASALLTSVPFTPAGLGFVEAGMVGILLLAAHLGLAPEIDRNLATSIAILDRTISYWSLIVVGLIVYVVTSTRRRRGVGERT